MLCCLYSTHNIFAFNPLQVWAEQEALNVGSPLLPKSKPTCHKGAKENGPGCWPWSREPWRWRPWPMGQTIGIPQVPRSRGHTFVAPQSSPWKRQPSKKAGTRRTPCQLTNHEEGATNAQCQRAQAPALLMKRCVSSMTRLPLVILWQLGLHVLCFLFAHMFSPGLTGLMQQQNFLYRFLCICVSIWCMKK